MSQILNNIRSILASVVLLAVLGVGLWWWSPWEDPRTIKLRSSAESVTFDATRRVTQGRAITTDTTGRAVETDVKGENVDAVVEVDSTQRLFVEAEPRTWFPEWRGPSRIRVFGSHSRPSGVRVTQQTPPVLATDWSRGGIGVGYGSSSVEAIASYTPIRVGPVEVGASLSYSRDGVLLRPAASVEVRSHLYVGVASLGDRETTSVFVAYRF